MDILFLIKSFIVLILLLGIFVFFLLSRPKKKKENTTPLTQEKKNKEKTLFCEFDDFLAVIKNRQSSSTDLQNALNGILKYHGTIPTKLGIRLHPEFYKYSEVMLRLCRHKNTNKDLIIHFYKQLSKMNPSYAKEINDALTKGINSLGV